MLHNFNIPLYLLFYVALFSSCTVKHLTYSYCVINVALFAFCTIYCCTYVALLTLDYFNVTLFDVALFDAALFTVAL